MIIGSAIYFITGLVVVILLNYFSWREGLDIKVTTVIGAFFMIGVWPGLATSALIEFIREDRVLIKGRGK